MENSPTLLMHFSRAFLILSVLSILFLSGCAAPAPAPINDTPVIIEETTDLIPTPSGIMVPPNLGPGPELVLCDVADEHENEECFEEALLQCEHAVASFWKTADGEILNFEVLNLTEEDTCRVRVYVDADSQSAFAGQAATCVLPREEGVFDAYAITMETCSGTLVESIQKTPPVEAQPSSPSVQSFSFTVDDDGVLGQQTFTVPKGSTVELTISVATSNVSFGGATIRGPAGNQNTVASIFDTGHIAPGQTATVSFVANQSFDFAVYWPSSNVQKGPKAQILVEG